MKTKKNPQKSSKVPVRILAEMPVRIVVAHALPKPAQTVMLDLGKLEAQKHGKNPVNLQWTELMELNMLAIATNNLIRSNLNLTAHIILWRNL